MRPLSTPRGPGTSASNVLVKVPGGVRAVCVHLAMGAVCAAWPGGPVPITVTRGATVSRKGGTGRPVVEAAPQARAGKSELPRTAWLIPGVLMQSSACLGVPLSCIAVCVWCNYLYLYIEGSPFWS